LISHSNAGVVNDKNEAELEGVQFDIEVDSDVAFEDSDPDDEENKEGELEHT
jgi:hypothetical protein